MKYRRILILLILALAISFLASCTGTSNESAKERLTAAIGTMLPQDRYTAASYKPYKEAYDEAVALSQSDNVTALTVDRAVDKLSSAKKQLVLKNDFTELQRQIDFFLGINDADYSNDSYENYRKAYESALEIMKNDESRQSEINIAASRMESAKRALMKIPDTSRLRSIVEAEVDASVYTGESYSAYAKAVEKGKEVLKKECPTLEELKVAENMLIEAFASLMLRGNTGDLSTLVNDVKTKTLVSDSKGRSAKNHFAAKGYNAVISALAEAEKCLNKGDASENEIKRAEDALRSAVKLLVDISPLLDAYDRAGEYSATIDNKEYTEESYKRLSEAMSVCYGLMYNPDVTQSEADDALYRLNNVIAAMEPVGVQPDGLCDKPIGGVAITVGKSAILLMDYMKDYTRFFEAVFSENPDFAYNSDGSSIVFSKGKCRITISDGKLTLSYKGGATVAQTDLDAFTFGGAKINEAERALTSERFFGVPTEYSETNEVVNGSVRKVAHITYINSEDGLSMSIDYDLKGRCVMTVTFDFTPPPSDPPENGPEIPESNV